MTEQEAQVLLKFKRETEVILAKGFRKMMGMKPGEPITDQNTFFSISEEIMRLAEQIK